MPNEAIATPGRTSPRSHPRTDLPQARVEFRALGPLEAVVAGQLADLGAPKQRALLALLVSRVGEPVTVDVMLEELWAGRPPPSAMTSLQAYVANVRRVLEPDRPPRASATVLRTLGRGYLLDSRAVDVDVQRFGERAAAGWQAWDRGDPRQALAEFDAGLALWRGEAYAEVADATSVAAEVARLEELRLSAVEGRGAALLGVGASELAVAELEAFMHAHPLREYGCELLSLALYRTGRQADALTVLRTNQKRLAEELGIDPRPELQHLEHEILNHSPDLDSRPAAAAVAAITPDRSALPPQVRRTGPPPCPVTEGEVFVGREAALRQLAEALAEAEAGRGRVVTVSGEPGIGKTSLLRRFVGLAGVPAFWGSCPEHVATPPFWLWEQVLRAISTCRPQWSMPEPVAELLDGGAARILDGDTITLRRFEAIVDYLMSASHSAPLVVVLDHLHRADPSSLRMLAHLAESVPASRLLVAVSYQPGEAAAISQALAALARAGMTRIELSGLTARDAQTLATAMLDHDMSASTAEELWARTGGHPVFLRELVRQLTREQRLDRPHAVPMPVPVPVRDMVLARIAQLPRTAGAVLSVAAIAGKQFDADVVADVASVGIGTALEALDAAVAAGLIVEDQDRLGWFRFAHAVTAEALRETTGRRRRAYLHRRIGAAAVRSRTGNAPRTARQLLPEASPSRAPRCSAAVTA